MYPECIIAFVRQRLKEIETAWREDKRPWCLRFLWGRKLKSAPSDIALVRQFAGCNIDDKMFHGEVIGKWQVSAVKVVDVSQQSPQDVRYLFDTSTLVLYDFAFTPKADVCLVKETYEGCFRLAIYALSNGCNSSNLGQIIDEVVETKTERTNTPPIIDYIKRRKRMIIILLIVSALMGLLIGIFAPSPLRF